MFKFELSKIVEDDISEYYEDIDNKTLEFKTCGTISFAVLKKISNLIGTDSIDFTTQRGEGCDTCGHGSYTLHTIVAKEVNFDQQITKQ